MTGKTTGAVLVTGGASGIGLETARLLLERGWQVFLIDLTQDALARACDDLGIPAENGIACSITDEAEVEKAVAAIAGLSGIVNSAGIAMDRPAVETSVEDFRRIVDVNLTGSFIA